MSNRKRVVPKMGSPDDKLVPEQFDALNAEFYQGFQKELIIGRLGLLCLLHEMPEAIEGLLAGGVSWGKLQLKSEPDNNSREMLKRNAELELVALRQHAAEVLFRVFWVHAHQEPCPWIALARFRNPGDLKRAIENYLEGKLWADADERRRFHARAVWGSRAIQKTGWIQDPVKQSVDTVLQWIETAARVVLEAPLYNAYKHGLAVVSSAPLSMSFGASRDPAESLTMEVGAGFKYIDRRLDQPNQRHYWNVVHEAVDFAAAAAEAAAFGTLLGTILEAGATDRGVTKPSQQVRVLNAQLTPDMVRNPDGKTGIFFHRFQQSLLYFK